METTENKETLSRFKKYLEQEGLTQKTFASRFNVKPSYISAIFVGRRGISAGLMKDMIKNGDSHSLEYILTGEESNLEKLKTELSESRMLISRLEGIITKAMKG